MEPATITVYVARQPIFDRRQEVFAYELLFRNGNVGSAQFTDGEKATAQVILNTFLDIGLDQVVGPRPAFLNVTRGFLVAGHWRLLPPERVVLEVLEDVGADPEVLAALKELRAGRYSVALDDFVLSEARETLLDRAQFVKLDVRALGIEGLTAQVERLRGRGLRLLAEKVETAEELAQCARLGIELFQGYHFCKPHLLSGQRLSPDRLGALRLLGALSAPDVEVSRLEHIIKSDVTLSYKLLRLINAACYSLGRRIDSVRDAVLLLGRQRVRAWVSLVVLAGLGQKPREVLTTAMVRARMCERIAVGRREPDSERFFTAGLLSLLDALLDQPMGAIVPHLPLSPEVGEALTGGAGRIGEVLRCAVAYERGAFEAASVSGLDGHRVRDAYLEGVRFAAEFDGADLRA